jgi:hypothetical protein
VCWNYKCDEEGQAIPKSMPREVVDTESGYWEFKTGGCQQPNETNVGDGATEVVTCAAAMDLKEEDVVSFVDKVFLSVPKSNGQVWNKVFKDTHPKTCKTIFDNNRKQMNMQKTLVAEMTKTGVVHRQACRLLKRGKFQGFTTEDKVMIMPPSILRSIRHKRSAGLTELMQRAHFDIKDVVAAELGFIHAMFITGKQGRIIRVMNCDTGEFQLLLLPPYTITILNGRWAHGGWGVQPDDPELNHDVIFAHIIMQKVPVDGSWLTKATKNNISVMLLKVSDELDEDDTTKLCSVTWPTRVVGTCAQCGSVGTVHKCGSVLDEPDECESLFCYDHFEKHSHDVHTEMGDQYTRPRHLKRVPTNIQSVLEECTQAEDLHSR